MPKLPHHIVLVFLNKESTRAKDVVQLVECLSSMHETLGLIPSKVVAHTCNASIREIVLSPAQAT